MDKIRALRYFRRAAELNSFTDAAKEFNVPASSISRRIKDLESELGVELLQRTTRNVKTSELGSVYYNMITEVLQKLDDADELISQQRDSIKGRIQISVAASYGEKILWPVLQEFQHKYPDIILDLDFSDKLVNLNFDSVDIAIRSSRAPNERVLAKQLASSALILVATPKYLAELEKRFGKKIFTVEDISNCAVLQYRSSSGAAPWWQYNEGEWEEISITPVMCSNNGTSLLASTLAHKGLSIFPLWWIQEHLKTGELVKIPTNSKISSDKSGDLDVYILYQKAKYQIPKIKCCVDFIMDRLC
ncbi:LysR family transcriptional regulator [Psychromonas aquimarina]|uniref:LysR family transcriptional regulator n=1 Tax=Psychromonas aquimarina TaxID=444919 RepID=UPI00040C35F1|nr:LysR family transcriptional regulator [Psychromonas aquimarina]